MKRIGGHERKGVGKEEISDERRKRMVDNKSWLEGTGEIKGKEYVSR